MTRVFKKRPRILAVFGHPGHELFLFQLFQGFEAELNCFTDGSGGRMADRTKWTLDVIKKFGGSVGPVFGEATDKKLYLDLLEGQVETVSHWCRKLVDRAVQLEPQYVVTDPFEYFNPVHDLANSVADCVVTALEQNGLFCQKLVYPNEYPKALKQIDAIIRKDLDADEIEEKIAAIEAYEPLRHEFARLTAQQKIESLRCETLFSDPVRLNEIPDACDSIYREVYYERYGREMVAAGTYEQVLTLDRHYRPFVSHLVRDCSSVPA